MKARSKGNNRKSLVVASVACMILAGSILAFAIPSTQVLRYTGNPVTFTGECCAVWKETVSFTEPKTVAPVMVTFSTDYQASLEGQVGISLNNGTCNLFFGPNRLPEFTGGTGGAGPFAHTEYRWLVNPSDGLKVGKNTFEVCGGGSFGGDATIVLGFNTLSVEISN